MKIFLNKVRFWMLFNDILLLLLCTIGLLFSEVLYTSIFVLIAVFAVMLSIVSAVLFFRFWRCPGCGKLLPFRDFYRLNFCPFCGHDLGMDVWIP